VHDKRECWDEIVRDAQRCAGAVARVTLMAHGTDAVPKIVAVQT
jgi:hypothetical protein